MNRIRPLLRRARWAPAAFALSLVAAGCTTQVAPLVAPTPGPPQPGDPQSQVAALEAQSGDSPVEGVEYTVAPDDSLWSIAEAHGVTLDEMLAANPGLADPDSLQVGDVIIVPIPPERAEETPTAEAEGTPVGTGLPDIVVTIPPLVIDGKLVLNVKNQGSGHLGEATIRVAVRQGDRTLAVASLDVEELRSGASVDIPTNVKPDEREEFTAVVDPDGLIDESVEDNNAVLFEAGE